MCNALDIFYWLTDKTFENLILPQDGLAQHNPSKHLLVLGFMTSIQLTS